MTINTELLTQIQSTLGAAVTPSLSTASDTSDIFEAYVFSLVIEAAKTEGATVSYSDVFGNIPTTFVFRRICLPGSGQSLASVTGDEPRGFTRRK